MTHRFDLLIRTSNELPSPSLAQLYLKTPQKDEEGRILITQEMTLSEIDGTINQLIAELEELQSEAKEKLGEEV
jgi:hypothetical protein